jgi:hypothetical protein
VGFWLSTLDSSPSTLRLFHVKRLRGLGVLVSIRGLCVPRETAKLRGTLTIVSRGTLARIEVRFIQTVELCAS